MSHCNRATYWIYTRIIFSDEAIHLPYVPKSIAIMGSGAVGVEFASIFRSFGAEVTIIELLPRLVPVEDEAVSAELQKSFKKKGITVYTGSRVTSAKASDILPNVPALAEAGLKDYEAELWYVVIAPAGLSPELTQRINRDIVKIVKSPEMQKKLADQGARPIGSSAAEAAAFMKAESEKWGKVIKEANIKGE